MIRGWALMWTWPKVVVAPADRFAPMERAGHTLTALNEQNGRWLLAWDANLLEPVRPPQL